MVPLDFLLSNRGRGFEACSPCIEDEDDEVVDEAEDRVGFDVVGSATAGMALEAGNVIVGLAVLCYCSPYEHRNCDGRSCRNIIAF